MKRISSIDVVRGLVMVIMVLDHTRDLLHTDSLTQSPTNLATTTPILFFTRWITHLCAPAFVFLAGTSAWLSLQAGPDKSAGRRFLLTRGLALIAIEFTLVNFGMNFDIRFRYLIFEVIATIGAGFIFLSFLSRLSWGVVAGIAALLFFGHDLLGLIPLPTTPVPRFISTLFFTLGIFPGDRFTFLIAYPILPWLGIMLAGFSAGRLFTLAPERRSRIFLRLGLGALGLFAVLRFFNLYGDPVAWTSQKTPLFTVLSFFNLNKYPPSLLFSLLMLGIILIVLSAAEGKDNPLTRFLLVYGRVPLFYFLVHFYLAHLLMLVMVFLQGYHVADLRFGPFLNGRPDKASGIPLWGVYLVWISLVLLLYPVCRWYGRYKAEHREKKWLRYL
ncbi:DUF1624 domain-containing protein [Puia sp.]|jgi:uncharacterized membrane protein|uniref:DUF1624 domain-containing protein n=1 Tax=Puia sp. TaxID=2045100 RepID=UPI002F3E9EB7